MAIILYLMKQDICCLPMEHLLKLHLKVQQKIFKETATYWRTWIKHSSMVRFYQPYVIRARSDT